MLLDPDSSGVVAEWADVQLVVKNLASFPATSAGAVTAPEGILCLVVGLVGKHILTAAERNT
jgi:hypothetical protein